MKRRNETASNDGKKVGFLINSYYFWFGRKWCYSLINQERR